MGPQRQESIGGGQHAKRYLFQHEPPNSRPLDRPIGCRDAAGLAEASQRPIVQQQQQGGDGDQHRLGQQPQRKRPGHQRVAGPAPPVADVIEIRPQRQDKQQPAQNISSLGNPDHAFDMLRMDGKQHATNALGHSSPVMLRKT